MELFILVKLYEMFTYTRVFLKENVRYPERICRVPISLMPGARFSLILGTR